MEPTDATVVGGSETGWIRAGWAVSLLALLVEPLRDLLVAKPCSLASSPDSPLQIVPFFLGNAAVDIGIGNLRIDGQELVALGGPTLPVAQIILGNAAVKAGHCNVGVDGHGLVVAATAACWSPRSCLAEAR
jgi:hypothetical protein